MAESENSRTDKKAYQKPELRVIELTADEVLAVGCKTATSAGALPFPPTCELGGCAAAGS